MGGTDSCHETTVGAQLTPPDHSCCCAGVSVCPPAHLTGSGRTPWTSTGQERPAAAAGLHTETCPAPAEHQASRTAGRLRLPSIMTSMHMSTMRCVLPSWPHVARGLCAAVMSRPRMGAERGGEYAVPHAAAGNVWQAVNCHECVTVQAEPNEENLIQSPDTDTAAGYTVVSHLC